MAVATFIAHLINQRVMHDLVALEILTQLLSLPTDDGIEFAVGFTRHIGQYLQQKAPKLLDKIFDQFRRILHEANVSKRVQYMVEVLFQVRKDGFKDHPAIPEGLDVVEEDNQWTHTVTLNEKTLDTQLELNVFKEDPNFEENEQKYQKFSETLLEQEEMEEEEGEMEEEEEPEQNRVLAIEDKTATDLINLRRTIYLTIMSSANFEECGHKLLRIKLRPGDEVIIFTNVRLKWQI